MENDRTNQSETRSSSPTHSHIAESSVAHAPVDENDTSSVTSEETQVSTTTAYLVPQMAVPASTPTAQSVVEGMNNLQFYEAAYTLGQLQTGTGPTSSILGEPPTPMIHHAVTRIKSKESNKGAERVSTPKPKTESDDTPPNEHVHENNIWEEIVREDLVKALERARQYAMDKARIDDSNTVEGYYSKLLTDVIKGRELKFDTKYFE